MSKRAVLGEGVLTVYRLVLVALVALIILGVSAIFFDYHIDVKDVEVRILDKQIINCLAEDGIFDLDSFPEDKKNNLGEYCDLSYSGDFWINVDVRDGSYKQLIELEEGDSGLEWIRELFSAGVDDPSVKNIKKYRAAYYSFPSVPVLIKNNGQQIKGELIVQGIVSHGY